MMSCHKSMVPIKSPGSKAASGVNFLLDDSHMSVMEWAHRIVHCIEESTAEQDHENCSGTH